MIVNHPIVLGAAVYLAIMAFVIWVGVKWHLRKMNIECSSISRGQDRRGWTDASTSLIGPLGFEFSGTRWPYQLSVGDVAPCRHNDQRALLVIGLDGETAAGSQLYRFRVIEAREAETAKP